MKKLITFALFASTLFSAAQDRIIRGDLLVTGEIQSYEYLEFDSLSAAKAFAYTSSYDGARVRINGYNAANDGFFGPDVFYDHDSAATADELAVFDPTVSGDGRLVRTFKGPINIKWAGAVGDNSTDDATEIQRVATYMSANRDCSMYIPASLFVISSGITLSGNDNAVFGDSHRSVIKLNYNGPAFTMDTDVADCYRNVFRNFTIRCVNAGTSTAGIYWGGDPSDNWSNYNVFESLNIEGCYYGIRIDRDVSTGSELRFDWNRFNGIQTTAFGGNSVEYAIYFDQGSGTGNIFTNLNLVSEHGGIWYDAQNSLNVGDIIINGSQFSTNDSNGASIYGGSGASYKERISITACQFDAGSAAPYQLEDYDWVTATGNTFGGGVAQTILTGQRNTEAVYSESNRRQFDVFSEDIATAGSDDLFTAEGFKTYSTTLFTVTSFGVIQGRSQAYQESVYRAEEKSGGGVTITQISTAASDTEVGTITHGHSGTDPVTISVTINSTADNSDIYTHVEYIGDGRPKITKNP